MPLKDGIYSRAKLVPSPNKGGKIAPTAIIVHDTAGSLRKGSSVEWLCNPQAHASAHFVVERDGSVSQLVSTNLRAWHAGKSTLNGRSNVNAFSIGIEIVNPGILKAHGTSGARASYGEVFSRKKYGIEERDEVRGPSATTTGVTHPAGLWMPYTEAQIASVLALCLDLADAYDITELRPHWYISPGRKIDTNPLFPLPWLASRVAGREDEKEEQYNFEGSDGGPLPGPRDSELCTLKPQAKLHEWPSFFKAHEVDRHFDPSYIILDNGMFNIAGDDGVFPEEVMNEQLHWVKLKHDSFGEVWTLFSNIEREEVGT